MNPATRLRLAKEARALLPFWAACAAWITLPFCLSLRDPASYAFSGFIFACAVLGPVSVGHEFAHGTLGTLLALPIPRRQIWREKLLVTGTALVSLSVLLVGLIQGTQEWSAIFPTVQTEAPSGTVLVVLVWILVPLIGFCTGPALTLITRNSLGGGAFTFGVPFLLQIAGLVLIIVMRKLSGVDESTFKIEEKLLTGYALGVGTVYSVLVYRSGWQWFERLEDAPLNHRELALPASLAQRLSGWTSYLLPARRGVMTSLLRKELRLQQPAFLVAAFFVAFWLACVGGWFILPHIATASLLSLPAIFLSLVVPVAVGIVATAEERSQGVHDWHLTLPVPALRQWLVKLFVALIVNVLCGLGLPLFLLSAMECLVPEEPQLTKLIADLFGPLLAANICLFSTTFYASTTAPNSMRAIVGGFALCLVAGLAVSSTMWVLDRLGLYQIPRIFQVPFREAGWPSPEVLYWAYKALVRLGWVILMFWFASLTFANFRRTLAVGWQPLRRVVPIFASAWLFLGATATLRPLIWSYQFVYYELNSLRELQWQKRLKQLNSAAKAGRGLPDQPKAPESRPR